VVAVAAAVLIPGHKAPTNGAAPAQQAQLPLGQGQPGNATANQDGSPAVQFSGNSQPMPLPMNGQPVVRGPLAEAAGSGDADGEDTAQPAAPTGPQSSFTPPTVTTTAPPVGVPAGPAATQVPVPTQPKPAPVAKAAPAPAAKPPVQVASAAKPEAKAPAPAKVAEKPVKAGAASGWYGSQAPTNYVVQILGTSNEAAAQTYVREQGGEYRYFKKNLQGKPLYVITYGSFANRAEALNAIKNLPAKVQAGKPWPRTVASVQQDLASAH
jgi:DamX protein